MDDLISRSAAINVIERTRAYIGHNMERAVGAAFIEILDDVGEDIGRLPSAQFATDTNVGTKLGTNLAQLGTDCISRQAAISAICNACGKIDCDKMDKCEKLQLPPANCSEFPNNSDTISRQAAIDVIDAVFPVDPMKSEYAQGIACGAALAKTYVEQLPSAQPELIEREAYIRGFEQGKTQGRLDTLSAQPKRTENTRKTHACDCISRQAAIDAILAVTGNSSVRELYEHVQEHGLSDMWSGGVNAAIDIIIAVPSAQPETCDTCKHGYFGDTQCDNCCVRYPSHYERRTDE